MVLVQAWVPRLQSDPPLRLDAKIQAVGLTRLLCEAPALLSDENGKNIWGQTLACVVKILTASSFAVQTADDEVDEIEIGYDATFSSLAYARKKLEDPFADVGDPVATFVTSLHGLSSSQPGVLIPVIQAGLRDDPKLSSGLESMFKKSGLQLG